MSNVTGLVFKSHFRLNIIIFKCNVIFSLLFGTSQSGKPRRRKTALLQMGARPKRRLQMEALLQMEARQKPPKRTTVLRRGQPTAKEDNRPPKRTTVRRRGKRKIGRCTAARSGHRIKINLKSVQRLTGPKIFFIRLEYAKNKHEKIILLK